MNASSLPRPAGAWPPVSPVAWTQGTTVTLPVQTSSAGQKAKKPHIPSREERRDPSQGYLPWHLQFPSVREVAERYPSLHPLLQECPWNLESTMGDTPQGDEEALAYEVQEAIGAHDLTLEEVETYEEHHRKLKKVLQTTLGNSDPLTLFLSDAWCSSTTRPFAEEFFAHLRDPDLPRGEATLLLQASAKPLLLQPRGVRHRSTYPFFLLAQVPGGWLRRLHLLDLLAEGVLPVQSLRSLREGAPYAELPLDWALPLLLQEQGQEGPFV